MGYRVHIYSSDAIRGKILCRAFQLEGADASLTERLDETSLMDGAKSADALIVDTKKRFDCFAGFSSDFEALKPGPEMFVLLEPKHLCRVKRSQVGRHTFFTEPFDPEHIVSEVNKRLKKRDSKKKSFIPVSPFCRAQPFRQNMFSVS